MPEEITILCFGDSLTEGYYEDGDKFHPYTRKLSNLLDQLDGVKFNVINKGISGEVVSTEMIERLPKVLDACTQQPDLVILLGGTNDLHLFWNFTDGKLAQEIFKLHQICIDRGIKTCAITLPELAPGYVPMTKECEDIWRETNVAIREYAAKNGVLLCDLEIKLPMFSLTKEDRDFLWDDDIHYTPAGYDKMAEIIYEHILDFLRSKINP